MLNRPTPPTDPFTLVAGRRDWRVELETQYQATATRLVSSYRQVLPELRRNANDLLREIERIEAATGEPVGYVQGLDQYGRLVRQIEVEMQDFAAIARFMSGELTEGGVQAGIDAALDAVGAQAQAAAAAWMRPDPAALERLIGYVDSAAMRAKFARFGANAANNFADTVLALTAQGKGAAAIARAVENWYHVPFAWAENMTRTVQNTSYRGASHASYLLNEALLDGWMWRAALDVRTCMSCISQHGTIHPVDETLTDHHRGRCTPVPVVKGTTWARGVEAGQDWYGRLPEGAQRRVAGDLLFTALRNGDAAWSDLSKAYDDVVFGRMLREASVSELVADGQRYIAVQRLAAQLPPNGTSPAQAAQIAAEVRTGT